WLPKMCSCIDGSSTLPSNRAASYERLGSNLTIFELNSTMRRSRRSDQDLIDSERQEELRFYNNDHSFTTVVVEKNLRTIDLCELLKVKRNTIGAAWSIIETWPKLGIERTLEDHEDILAVHRELEMFASQYERRFYFSQDFLKYEVFIKPVQFFPSDMITFPSGEERGTFTEAESALRNYLLREDSECPYVFSMVWMRNASSNGWKKMYMLLQGRKLYTTKKELTFMSDLLKVAPMSVFIARSPIFKLRFEDRGKESIETRVSRYRSSNSEQIGMVARDLPLWLVSVSLALISSKAISCDITKLNASEAARSFSYRG
ncbi:GRB10 protein, partial [Pseudoatta argentina]